MYEYKYQKYKNKYMNIKQIDGGCNNIGEGGYGFVYDFNSDFINYFTDFNKFNYLILNPNKKYIIKIFKYNENTYDYNYAIKIDEIIKSLILDKNDQTFEEYLNNSLIIDKGIFNINKTIYDSNNSECKNIYLNLFKVNPQNKIFNYIILENLGVDLNNVKLNSNIDLYYFLKSQLNVCKFIGILNKNHYYHNDLKLYNIIYNKSTNTSHVIDFDLLFKFTNENELEKQNDKNIYNSCNIINKNKNSNNNDETLLVPSYGNPYFFEYCNVKYKNYNPGIDSLKNIINSYFKNNEKLKKKINNNFEKIDIKLINEYIKYTDVYMYGLTLYILYNNNINNINDYLKKEFFNFIENILLLEDNYNNFDKIYIRLIELLISFINNILSEYKNNNIKLNSNLNELLLKDLNSFQNILLEDENNLIKLNSNLNELKNFNSFNPNPNLKELILNVSKNDLLLNDLNSDVSKKELLLNKLNLDVLNKKKDLNNNNYLNNLELLQKQPLLNNQKIIKLINTNTIAKRNIRNLENEITNLESDIAKLKGDIAKLKGDIINLNNEIIKLERDITKLKSEIAKLKSDIINLNNELNKTTTLKKNN